MRLDLSRCAIDDKELAKLLTALRLNTVLVRLDLRQTRLSDEGARNCMEVKRHLPRFDRWFIDAKGWPGKRASRIEKQCLTTLEAELLLLHCSSRQMMTSYSGVVLRLKELDLRGCRRMGRAAGQHYHDHIDKMHASITSFNGLDLPNLAQVTDTVRRVSLIVVAEKPPD
jgi:hypothetical protein